MSIGSLPFGSTPFGAPPSTGPALVSGVVNDSVSVASPVLDSKYVPVGQAFSLLSPAIDGVYAALIERVRHADTLGVSTAMLAIEDASLGLDDEVRLGWRVLAQATAGFGETAIYSVAFLQLVEDVLLATGAVSTSHAATVALGEALIAETLARSGWLASASESAAFADALAEAARSIIVALETVNAAATATPALRMLAIAADEADIDEAFALTTAMSADVSDGVLVYTVLTLGGVDYVAYAMTTATQAFVEYQNYPFNSFATDNGRYFGASDQGIYELVGDDDDGAEIEAWVRSALSNLGTTIEKRMYAAYLGYTADKTPVLKIITTRENGQKVEDWYTAVEKTAEAPREHRIKIGRGLKSVYWAWELRNVDGADFALDVVEFHPLLLNRRV